MKNEGMAVSRRLWLNSVPSLVARGADQRRGRKFDRFDRRSCMASRASSKSKASKGAAKAKAGKATGAGKAVKGAMKAAASKVAAKKPAKKPIAAAPKAIAKAKKLAKKIGSVARAGRAKLAAAIQPTPPRYHTVTPFLNVKGAQDAIEFYKNAFGAEERMRMPNADGSIMHAELTIGDSTIMLSDAIHSPETRSSIHLTVPDCDALYERAVSAGGTQKMPLQDMFWGDRYGTLEDPFGNVWAISTHKEDVAPDELARRAAAAEPPPAAPAMNSTSTAFVAE
jgi:PhnB protein